VGAVVCGLGVGEHFRRWRFNNDNIIELDWNESVALTNDITLYVLPAQHYSGRRGFNANNTLWVSFMIQAPSKTIFISGDTGHGAHFAEIGQQFPEIDLAILEFGAYGHHWRDIHIIPEHLPLSINYLNPRRSFASHNSMFSLGRHPWREPLEFVAKLIDEYDFDLITPKIGEKVYLLDFEQEFTRWWKDVK
jgi:L-ascorbate metabolism protein UlaG (beta-lactamase superfamily)